MSEFQCPGKPVGQRLGEIPAGEATELRHEEGMAQWRLAVLLRDAEQGAAKARLDDPEAWALEPLHP